MAKIMRGTTTQINATVPLDLTDYTLYLSIGDLRNPRLTITGSQIEVTVEGETSTIAATLTQADTLALKAGKTLMQLRGVKDGYSFASYTVGVTVLELVKDGVIYE